MPATFSLEHRVSSLPAGCSKETRLGRCCSQQQFSRWLRKLASKLTWPSSTLTMAFWPGTLRRSPPHCRCFTSVRWPSDSNSTSRSVSYCELVAVGQTPVAATQHHFPPLLLFDEQGADRVVRNFTLLGAPIGDDAFCGAHTAARAKLAGPLLDHIAELEDRQIGLRLLKSSRPQNCPARPNASSSHPRPVHVLLAPTARHRGASP